MPQPQAKPRPRIQAKYHIDFAPSVEICGIAFDLLGGDRPLEHAEHESRVSQHDRWRLKFGDMIHTGEIDPAYLMFYVFQQRNRERMDYALKLLESEPDWTREESFA